MTNPRVLQVLSCFAVLATISFGANAQQDVNVSGFLDVGVYRGFDGNKMLGTIQRSNIAFSGGEDLGGGLSATWKLSHRLDLDTGTEEGAGRKPFWHGESTIGLKGGLGHLRLGRALDVVYANDWAYDPWYNFNRIASPAWNLWHYNYATDRTGNRGSAEYGRLSRGVFYDSPSLRGVTLHLSGAFKDSAPAPGAGTDRNFGASLNYDSAAISLMAARSMNSSGDTVKFFGGKYTVGGLQLMGAYDVSVFKAAVDSEAKVATLGAVYGLGATALKVGVGHLDADGLKTAFVGLGADRHLSKRTTLYVSAGQNRPKAGNSSSAYGAGLSHSF
ncbi:porin [Caldimonas tepidiphila]|uniref:porin n=1 Tax=Caldimonas tepidiphila TaxID=2315841 RepID=UPI000E5AD7F9|nr:porin [Caldimonas tepidiphila]